MRGVDFAVRSTDRTFLDGLRGYLAGFEVPEGTEDLLYSADCGVERTLAGGKAVLGVNRLYLGGLRIFQGVNRDQMAGRLIGSVRDMATSYEDSFVRIRAGGVVLDGGSMILPSPPQPHLASLVASMVRSGAGYLGDELIHIDPVLRNAHPIASPSLPLLLHESDLGDFPELGRRPARRRSREREESPTLTRRPVVLEELGGWAAAPVPIRWIVFPEFLPGARTELRAVAPSQALFSFSSSVLNFHVWGDRALVLIRELLEGRVAARLVVGSIPEAARLLGTGSIERLAG